MTFAGKIDKNLLTEVIKPALQNFEDMSYDVSPAKKALVEFICKKCKTDSVSMPPTNIDKYSLSVIQPDGFCMVQRDDRRTEYLFSATSGKAYVVESVSDILVLDKSYMTFDTYLMIMTNSIEGKPRLIK
jgi:hypothetical protein